MEGISSMNEQKLINYKYLTWNEETDDSEEVIFSANDDAAAIKYALQEEAQTNEEGLPYLYRENEPTSTYGCGHNCVACCGWVDITDELTVHGSPIA